MGMAVDSNVLIYERIREESKNGRPLIQAIDIGFKKAFATIVDANLTTLIAAVVLFFLGSGPVRGFAVTLSIGIVTTVFTAFTPDLLADGLLVSLEAPEASAEGVRTGFFDSRNIRFMAVRKYNFGAAMLISVASLVGFATVGMNLGIDFKGGSIIEVQARNGTADLSDIRERLSQLNLGEIQAQGFGDASSALIRLQAQRVEKTPNSRRFRRSAGNWKPNMTSGASKSLVRLYRMTSPTRQRSVSPRPCLAFSSTSGSASNGNLRSVQSSRPCTTWSSRSVCSC